MAAIAILEGLAAQCTLRGMKILAKCAIVVILLGLSSCATQKQKGIELGDLDRNADPCSDFYEFANGTWRSENPIPATMPKWSRRVAAHEGNRQQVQALLEEISAKTDWPSGSTEQLVGDHFASCMDQQQIDAAGLTPLAPLLAEIDGIEDRDGVQRAIRRLHDIAINVPFGTSGAPEYQEPTRFLLNLVAGNVADGARFAEASQSYEAHIANVLMLAGVPDGESAAAAAGILGLEKRLAEVALDSATAGDPAATDHKMTFAQLEQLAPHFDWGLYFDEAKLPRVDLNVAEPKFIERVDRELTETPVDVWKSYLKWQLLDSASPWLSEPFASESSAFTNQHLPRAQQCVASTDALFGEALGKKYAERYFPPAAKAKAREIADHLLAVLKEDVTANSWMRPETRKVALAKVAAMDVQLGYPDQWKDYSAVTIRRDAFWANVIAGRKFQVDEARQRIGKPTDRIVWQLSPSSPDAYIDPPLNVLVLPAGFLQPPYFNAAATDAVNYGALGIGLAHDLTHAIDVLGSGYDVAGRPQSWWTDADRKAFDERAACVVEQYENYFIEPGVHHQGKRVRGEAVGDLAGVNIAWRALELSMRTHPVPVVDGFTPGQQFFIAWGQTTGSAMRIEEQRRFMTGDSHPVPKFRVIGPLSSSPEFARAFGCKTGAPMVQPPEQLCKVW
jgi:putative endopeptidase